MLVLLDTDALFQIREVQEAAQAEREDFLVENDLGGKHVTKNPGAITVRAAHRTVTAWLHH